MSPARTCPNDLIYWECALSAAPVPRKQRQSWMPSLSFFGCSSPAVLKIGTYIGIPGGSEISPLRKASNTLAAISFALSPYSGFPVLESFLSAKYSNTALTRAWRILAGGILVRTRKRMYPKLCATSSFHVFPLHVRTCSNCCLSERSYIKIASRNAAKYAAFQS
jgi:hypothetical protein